MQGKFHELSLLGCEMSSRMSHELVRGRSIDNTELDRQTVVSNLQAAV
jgi:hypothetical protein